MMMIANPHTCTHTLNARHALPGAPGISRVCACAQAVNYHHDYGQRLLSLRTGNLFIYSMT